MIPPSNVLFIKEIPKDVGITELEDLFKKEIGFKDIRKLPYFAFVEFETIKDAEQAMRRCQNFRFSSRDKGLIIDFDKSRGGRKKEYPPRRREEFQTRRYRENTHYNKYTDRSRNSISNNTQTYWKREKRSPDRNHSPDVDFKRRRRSGVSPPFMTSPSSILHPTRRISFEERRDERIDGKRDDRIDERRDDRIDEIRDTRIDERDNRRNERKDTIIDDKKDKRKDTRIDTRIDNMIDKRRDERKDNRIYDVVDNRRDKRRDTRIYDRIDDKRDERKDTRIDDRIDRRDYTGRDRELNRQEPETLPKSGHNTEILQALKARTFIPFPLPPFTNLDPLGAYGQSPQLSTYPDVSLPSSSSSSSTTSSSSSSTTTSSSSSRDNKGEGGTTLYVYKLPNDTTEREMSILFRFMPGFVKCRLIHKGYKGTFCFVDFTDPGSAAYAKHCLQNFRMDLRDTQGIIIQYDHGRENKQDIRDRDRNRDRDNRY